MKRREVYDVKFKLVVLQRVRHEALSFRQAAALFDIRNFNIIGLWQRAYESDGMAGLLPYRVVRHGSITKEKFHPPRPSRATTRHSLVKS